MSPTSVDADSDDSKKRKATPGSILQRKVPRLDAVQWVYNILLVFVTPQTKDSMRESEDCTD
jgi:hypothetical protein